MFITTFNPFAFYIHDPVYQVPGHTYGQLEVYNVETGAGPWNIAAKANDGGDWSYHWVIFKDVNADGLLDVMAARFHVGLLGDTKSELIWLQNPGGLTPDNANKEWSSGWKCHVVFVNGPDVRIENRKMSKGDKRYDVLMAAELWNQKLSLNIVEDKPAAWNFSFPNSPNIKRVILDEYDGQPFEANFMDLNNDGIDEIVASYFDVGQKKGFLVAYEQKDSDNWDSADGWTKRVIRGDFLLHNPSYSKGDMTPGKHRLFYPSKDYEASHKKPWISLAGDDNG